MPRLQRVVHIVPQKTKDIDQWLQIPPNERVAIVQDLREEYMKWHTEQLKDRIHDPETGKRLRRVYRIIERS